MNRPIKFRAWDKTAKKMREPFDLEHVRDTFSFTQSTGFALQYDPMYERRDVEVMQFTGLLDKTGREIYEGDFVRDVRNSGDQMFHWGGKVDDGWGDLDVCVVKWDDNTGYRPFIYHGDQMDGKDCVVIGNIHETPGLLKVKKNGK